MSKSVSLSFGEQLKSLRKKHKITQVQMSQAASLSKSYISFLESDVRHPSREVVLRLGKILQLSGTELDRLLVAAQYAPLHAPTSPAELERVVTPQDFDTFEPFMHHVMQAIRSGDKQRAQDFIDHGFQHFNRPAQMQTLLAHLELSKGHYEHAVISQQAAVQHARLQEQATPEAVDYLLNLGVMEFLWGDHYLFEQNNSAAGATHYHQALKAFEKGLQLQPEHLYLLDEAARVHFNLADTQSDPEHWKASQRLFRQVLAHPHHEGMKRTHRMESAAFLGLAYAKTGDFEAAGLILETLNLCNTREWWIPYIQACYYGLQAQHAGAQQKWVQLALSSLLRAHELDPASTLSQLAEDQHKDLASLVGEQTFQKLQKESLS